jgi:hypothetical protein
MTQVTKEVPQNAWQSYFDDFSRRISTVEATIEVDGRDLGAQIAAQDVVLTGVTYDRADDVLVIGLDAPGGEPEELQRIIDHPQRIFVEGGFAEQGMAIAVDDADGHRTIITLVRPPALTPGTEG